MIHLIRKFINTKNTALDVLIEEGNESVKEQLGTTAGNVTDKLNKIISDLTAHISIWTSTRAGYIDSIRSYTITNNTANKTGVLSAKLAYVISLLENSTYGLSALKKVSKGAKPLRVISGTQTATSAYEMKTLLDVSGAGNLCFVLIGTDFQYDTGRIELKVTIDGVVRFWRRTGTDTATDYGNPKVLSYGCPWYGIQSGDYPAFPVAGSVYMSNRIDDGYFLSYPDNSTLIEGNEYMVQGAYTEAIPFNSSLKVEIAGFGTFTRNCAYTVGYTLD